jgi:arylsulfatase A-like enzyme
MSLYGYDLATTPHLDSHSDRALIFDNAYCCATNTDPSLTAIFTGRYPTHTGIHNHGARVTSEELHRAYRLRYVSEILHANDYRTSAVDVSDRWHRKGFDEYLYQTKSNMYGLGSIGNYILDRFHAYDIFFSVVSAVLPTDRLPTANLKAEDVTDCAIRTMATWKGARNLFFVHYWNTHTPYSASQKLLRKFAALRSRTKKTEQMPIRDVIKTFRRPFLKPIDVAWLKRLSTVEDVLAAYDAAVANIDEEIGRLLNSRAFKAIEKQTVVILTSDHGESLTEHEIFFDHHGLYEQVSRVPLVFLLPPKHRIQPGRIGTLVSHVDLAPTILELAGVAFSPNDFDGRSLLSTVPGKTTVRPVFIEEAHFERKRAVRLGAYKLIQAAGGQDDGFSECAFCGRAHGDSEELFDLENDPSESSNLAAKQLEMLKVMRGLLLHFVVSPDWVSR